MLGGHLGTGEKLMKGRVCDFHGKCTLVMMKYGKGSYAQREIKGRGRSRGSWLAAYPAKTCTVETITRIIVKQLQGL